MKLIIKLVAAGLSALALTGCFDGSDDNSSQTPQPPMSVDFTTFVQGEFANPDPNREPAKLNEITFNFNDQNNPQAFDDLLR